ncbi:MAG: tol-pal system-associated acyl-CoA thioesterase [Halieaceae bacterium]|nr:tol-pal system-associated acyl-CoA thioesterase [Halieaceae bacterium]
MATAERSVAAGEVAEFSHPLRVYIEDTDAGGIVYYVNYLKFMERARTEYMRSIGFDRDAIFNTELMFVVRDVQVHYREPARLDDELEVTARLLDSGGAYILLAQSVRRGEEILAEGEVKIVCVDQQKLVPRRMPAQLLAALKSGATIRGEK